MLNYRDEECSLGATCLKEACLKFRFKANVNQSRKTQKSKKKLIPFAAH